MSGWLTEAAQEVSEAVDAEFGTAAQFLHMVKKPNERAKPDPNLPRYVIDGVFHERRKPMGAGHMHKDGLSVTWLTSAQATFSAPLAAFKSPPKQDDLIFIPEIKRAFRVSDISYEMASRTRLHLENLEAMPAA